MIPFQFRQATSGRQNKAWLPSIAMLLFLVGSFSVAATAAPQTLTLTDSSGRAVKGIICDNLPGIAPTERNYVVVGGFASIESYKFTTPNGTDGDAHNNAGEARIESGQLRYYPPAEFNPQQASSGQALAITEKARRSIELLVAGRDKAGQRLEGTATILLARPTVVLVHGINNTPGHWNGTNDNGVGSELAKHGFTVAPLNHGKTAYEELLKQAQEEGKEPPGRDFAALFFRGNGPVEFAAGRLCQTVQDALEKNRTHGFAARRVDIVAHSYGGVISRWYLRSNALHSAAGTAGEGQNIGHASRLWYTNSNYPGGKDLYDLPPTFLDGAAFNSSPSHAGECPIDHARSVRKLIAIASPWRGVPVANFVNETHGPVEEAPSSVPEEVSLRRKRIGFKRLGWYINKAIPVPVRVPAMEVLGVNSRWLWHLNDQPFIDDIAYGAIAGNDNAYQLGIDLNTALDRLLSPSWFVYFGLEHRPKSRINYSDGLVPVWSAVIEEKSPVIPATHNKILRHPQARRYVLEALSRSDITRGATLNQLWANDWEFSMPLAKADQHKKDAAGQQPKLKTWHFKQGHMAPGDRDKVYVAWSTSDARSGVARISQQALREVRMVEARSLGPAPQGGSRTIVLSWNTTVPTLRPRVTFHGQNAREAEVVPSTEPLLPGDTAEVPQTRHELLVRGLRLNTPYKFAVQSEIPNPPDQPLKLSSRALTLIIKP